MSAIPLGGTLPAHGQITAAEWSLPGQRSRRVQRSNPPHPNPVNAMPASDRPNTDPNAELRSFEPLRVSLALGALLLGFLLGAY